MNTPRHSPQWQPYNIAKRAIFPTTLADWIKDAGSFIQRVKRHGITSPCIQVRQQSWQCPMQDEYRPLGLRQPIYVLIREVLITHQTTPLMFARTLFPVETLTGQEKQLAYLKNRSLGSVLFKHPLIKRSHFEIARLTPDMPWYQKINHHTKLDQRPLWARRSLFQMRNKKILLTEIFLPGLENCLKLPL